MSVAVIGLGRAGLPLAGVIAESGTYVFGIDIDTEKCDMINSGENPYPDEPDLDQIIEAYGGDVLYATPSCVPDCGVYVVIVPVGLTPDNKPDFKYLEKACRSVGRVLKEDDLVIVETTVPVGTTETLVRGWLEDVSGLRLGDFYLAHSPERIMAGMAVTRLKTFPKIVGGVDSASGLKAHNFYSGFLPDVRLAPDSRTAEFTKIAEGTYRDVNIALANELYVAASTYNIDYHEVRRLANHAFCHLHLAGIGVGGHCVPVYPHFLISDNSIARPELVEHSRVLNDGMIDYWVTRIMFEIDYSPEVKVCIHEIGYRPDTAILTNSRPVVLYHALKDMGVDVYVYDDLFAPDEVESLGLRWIEVEDADVVFNPFTLVMDHA